MSARTGPARPGRPPARPLSGLARTPTGAPVHLRRTAPTAPPFVALYTAGQLTSYLLPTVVARLGDAFALSPARAGALGSGLLLCSAGAGVLLASRAGRYGPRRTARAGLLLALAGYGTAALADSVEYAGLGALAGGLGSGTAAAVASAGIAGQRDPHRTCTLGLLSLSALAAAAYLTVPRLGPGHTPVFAVLALTAALVLPATARLTDAPGPDSAPGATDPDPLPYRHSGPVLAGAMVFWAMAQNALWGVSARIGAEQAGLDEVAIGVVFAVALGAGLLGVAGAGALGARPGRALPIGVGTALIACCIALAARAEGPVAFAVGEIGWNACYPFVLAYLTGLAAALDDRGRWAVLVGAASSLGIACGPLTGGLLVERAGFPTMGLVLGALLLLLVVPLMAVALRVGGRAEFGMALRVRAADFPDAAHAAPTAPAPHGPDTPEAPDASVSVTR
ncbi:MFS transporter [Streptomyces sp. NPDC005955]|uniref:MFS transporter n=1 Tax=Streptomyces sp. NPDC005955 TaxID=3364738 RepID=UPI0036A93911